MVQTARGGDTEQAVMRNKVGRIDAAWIGWVVYMPMN